MNCIRYHVDIPILQEKLDKHIYYCVQDFVNDIELAWSNVLNYLTTSQEEYGKPFLSIRRKTLSQKIETGFVSVSKARYLLYLFLAQ